MKEELDIYKQKHLRGHEDKVRIYRLAVDVVSDLLGDLDLPQQASVDPTIRLQRWDKFNRGRMRAYGYLAMLAPQSVMDASDALFDNLMQVSHGQRPYEWPKVSEFSTRIAERGKKGYRF